jgi:2-dehydropantoate 2-reductase
VVDRILVWGAGAIGGSVGAWLSRAGRDVTFVDTSAPHVEAMRRTGLHIVGPVDEFTVHAPAFLPEELTGEWDVVLLAVKAQHTALACDAFVPHLSPRGYTVSLQNGLCEERISRIVGTERTVGALIGFAGDQIGPGQIRFGQRAKFCIGELDGNVSDRIIALRTLLRDFEPQVEVTENIWGYLWGKLGFIGLLYTTSLGISPMVELFRDQRLLPAWRAVAGEIVEVAMAGNVIPVGFDGFDPQAFVPDAPDGAARCCLDRLAAFLDGSPKTHSGIWRDIAIHRRRTEIDEQIVPVIEAAGKHGIEVPALRELTRLVHRLERGELAQSDELVRGFAASVQNLAEPAAGMGAES